MNPFGFLYGYFYRVNNILQSVLGQGDPDKDNKVPKAAIGFADVLYD